MNGRFLKNNMEIFFDSLVYIIRIIGNTKTRAGESSILLFSVK